MALIDQAAQSISSIVEPNVRRALARALMLSYGSGPSSDALPTSASDVLATTGLSASMLLKHHVLLSKAEIEPYLSEFGVKMNIASVRKTVTAMAVSERFADGREIVRVGRKLVLTYAETRHLFDITTRIALPPMVETSLFP